MKELPDKLYLKRGEVREYLDLSEGAMTKLVRAKALTPLVFPGMTRAVFERSQVQQVKAREMGK